MEPDKRQHIESVFSKKIRAGRRRTYFFDVRQTKGEDYYLTMTESTKRFNGTGYERHKIFLYKEDFNRFLAGMEEAINHVKTDLMPDYDYDEFTKKQAEWERQRALEDAEAASATPTEASEASTETESTETSETTEEETPEAPTGDSQVKSEDDMSW